MPEEPLPQLISRLREPAQREDAFATLFRRFHDQVYRSFPASLPAALRSELTQEVFLKVYTHLEEIPADHFAPWLHRVARRTFLTWYQREHQDKREGITVPLEVAEVERSSQSSAEGAPSEPTPLAAALRMERQQVILAAVEELPLQMRSCLLLRLMEDCSVEEIARLLHLAPGTVKAHLHAARSRLKPKLAGYFARMDLAEEGV